MAVALDRIGQIRSKLFVGKAATSGLRIRLERKFQR